MSIFEKLRALDDRDELRSLCFASTDVPMWPFVRWLVITAAQEHALGQQPAFASSEVRSVRQLAGLVGRAAVRGPLSARGTFDVVIVGSSAGIVARRRERWLDRINDYFAMELPESTLVLDVAQRAGYKTPRVPPHVRAFDTFDLVAAAAARVRRVRDEDLAAIDRLIGILREVTTIVPSVALVRVRAQLVHWALRLPVLRGLYARFFDRVQPSVLVVEDGSYGAFAHVMTWARAAGIATAEFQHGVISRSHLAYNYGDAARADARFARCLPQYLLVYGELWRAQTRTPSEIVVIGCPHFTETAGTAGRSADGPIVTVSQGICTERMVELTTAVARAFPTRRCVFRLHPGEVAMRERYASLAGIPNVEVSERGDIYPLLRDASVVIGHSSTALVEAAGIGVPVLVADDEGSRAILPHVIGTWFRTAGELVTLVASPPVLAVDPAQFFAPDWRERYRSFILAHRRGP